MHWPCQGCTMYGLSLIDQLNSGEAVGARVPTSLQSKQR